MGMSSNHRNWISNSWKQTTQLSKRLNRRPQPYLHCSIAMLTDSPRMKILRGTKQMHFRFQIPFASKKAVKSTFLVPFSIAKLLENQVKNIF